MPLSPRTLGIGYALVGMGWAQYLYPRALREAMQSKTGYVNGVHKCYQREACEEVSPGVYTCGDGLLTDSDKRFASTVAVLKGLAWPLSITFEVPYQLNELFSRKPK